jgi:CHAD domain-containing protein
MPVSLADEQTASFRLRLEAFSRELPGVEQGIGESVHRARVASRRLRELIPLLDLNPDVSRKLVALTRVATHQLGEIRELDVALQLADELERISSGGQGLALRRLASAIASERHAARRRFRPARARAKYERLARKLERAVQLGARQHRGRRGPTTSLDSLDARAARRAKALQSAIDSAGSLYAPGPLHQVRIALKKLRYSAELLQEIGHRRLAAALAEMKSAQDLLGRLHDLDRLLAWCRRVQASFDPVDRATWPAFDQISWRLQTDCRTLHAAYMRHRAPLEAIAARLGSFRSATALDMRRAG